MSLSSNLLFLYLKTGGGHLAPAKAIADWISQSNPNKTKVTLHDGFEGVLPIMRWLVEDGYRHSQAKGKWLFESLYAINKLNPFAYLSSWLVSVFVTPALERKILEEKPTKIINFHFFLIKPIYRIVRKNNLNIPVLTVVTDPFTAHPIWFLIKDQQFIVFSDYLKLYLEKIEKIEPSRISVFPFVLNPKFSLPSSNDHKLFTREGLGIKPKSKVILLLGGADGIPQGAKLIKNLAISRVDADVVVVCGRNNALFRKANKIKTKYNFDRLHTLGYIDYVYDLLCISDVVITKCGASTFMEVLLCGKIPLVNSYIWEQEKGNVDFIRHNKMGIYDPNPKRIIQFAIELINNENFRQYYTENIFRMKLSNGTPLVSNYILKN